MANKQTIATSKYQTKVGLIAKTYKIKKEVADAFADKCKENNVGIASTITTLMQKYIDGDIIIEEL